MAFHLVGPLERDIMVASSHLFRMFDPNEKANEQFLEDLRFIFSLDDDALIAATDTAVGERLSLTIGQGKALVENFLDRFGALAPAPRHALDVLRFFTEKRLQTEFHDDDAASWVRDLQEYKVVDPTQAESLTNTLSRLLAELDRQVVPELERRRLFSALPSFGGATTAVLRAAILKGNGYSTREPVSAYTPTIIETANVVSISVRVVRNDESESVVFFLTENQLRLFLDQLQAARQDLDALAKFGGSTARRRKRSKGRAK